MIVSTVEQLLQMSVGAKPEAIRGMLTRVYEHKPTERGTMQKGVLAGNGQTIEIVFCDRVPVTFTGREIICTAASGQRGLTGLTRKENTWGGKTTPQIWVAGQADVGVDGDDGSQGQQQQPPQQQNQPPPQQQQKPQQQAPANQQQKPQGQQAPPPANGAKKPSPFPENQKQQTEQQVTNYRWLYRKLMQRMNLYTMCFSAAHEVKRIIEEKHGPGSFSDSQHQAAVSSMFIAMTSNRRDGFEDYSPNTIVDKDWTATHLAPKAKPEGSN